VEIGSNCTYPHSTGKHDLDLLATRKTRNLVVVGNFGVETDIFEMLADDLGLELAETKALTGSLMIIELLDQLLETALEERLSGDHGVVLWQPTNPLHFVLE